MSARRDTSSSDSSGGCAAGGTESDPEDAISSPCTSTLEPSTSSSPSSANSPSGNSPGVGGSASGISPSVPKDSTTTASPVGSTPSSPTARVLRSVTSGGGPDGRSSGTKETSMEDSPGGRSAPSGPCGHAHVPQNNEESNKFDICVGATLGTSTGDSLVASAPNTGEHPVLASSAIGTNTENSVAPSDPAKQNPVLAGPGTEDHLILSIPATVTSSEIGVAEGDSVLLATDVVTAEKKTIPSHASETSHCQSCFTKNCFTKNGGSVNDGGKHLQNALVKTSAVVRLRDLKLLHAIVHRTRIRRAPLFEYAFSLHSEDSDEVETSLHNSDNIARGLSTEECSALCDLCGDFDAINSSPAVPVLDTSFEPDDYIMLDILHDPVDALEGLSRFATMSVTISSLECIARSSDSSKCKSDLASKDALGEQHALDISEKDYPLILRAANKLLLLLKRWPINHNELSYAAGGSLLEVLRNHHCRMTILGDKSAAAAAYELIYSLRDLPESLQRDDHAMFMRIIFSAVLVGSKLVIVDSPSNHINVHPPVPPPVAMELIRNQTRGMLADAGMYAGRMSLLASRLSAQEAGLRAFLSSLWLLGAALYPAHEFLLHLVRSLTTEAEAIDSTMKEDRVRGRTRCGAADLEADVFMCPGCLHALSRRMEKVRDAVGRGLRASCKKHPEYFIPGTHFYRMAEETLMEVAVTRCYSAMFSLGCESDATFCAHIDALQVQMPGYYEFYSLLDRKSAKKAKNLVWHEESLLFAMDELMHVTTCHNPREAMASFRSCRSVLSELCTAGEGAASADDCLPMLCYTILRARPKNLLTSLQAVSVFYGEEAFTHRAFVDFCVAVKCLHSIPIPKSPQRSIPDPISPHTKSSQSPQSKLESPQATLGVPEDIAASSPTSGGFTNDVDDPTLLSPSWHVRSEAEPSQTHPIQINYTTSSSGAAPVSLAAVSADATFTQALIPPPLPTSAPPGTNVSYGGSAPAMWYATRSREMPRSTYPGMAGPPPPLPTTAPPPPHRPPLVQEVSSIRDPRVAELTEELVAMGFPRADVAVVVAAMSTRTAVDLRPELLVEPLSNLPTLRDMGFPDDRIFEAMAAGDGNREAVLSLLLDVHDAN
eukprot:Rmarinus@m.5921